MLLTGKWSVDSYLPPFEVEDIPSLTPYKSTWTWIDGINEESLFVTVIDKQGKLHELAGSINDEYADNRIENYYEECEDIGTQIESLGISPSHIVFELYEYVNGEESSNLYFFLCT